MKFREIRKRIQFLMHGEASLPGYSADGMRLLNKNLSFLDEPRFSKSWEFSRSGNRDAWEPKISSVPDVRFRIHTALWAAGRAMALDGDFVEFGVNAGFLSMAICDYYQFEKVDRKFWLFDTFKGIPVEGLSSEEAKAAESHNRKNYIDVFEIATRNFAKYPNAILVRGSLPGTIKQASITNIAYLSIDLNNATFEKASIEAVWDRVAVGAPIVLDDYAFAGSEGQNAMWNEFAKENGQIILTLPTGQGLLLKQ